MQDSEDKETSMDKVQRQKRRRTSGKKQKPVESRDFFFSTPIQIDPGAHPASYTTVTGSLFPG
jgi:hypothetical protein